jgi:hypothetical protein
MNFHYKFVLFLFIFFKFIVPQIDKNIFKVSSKDLCTRTTRKYNSERSVASARLNYYESKGWDTSALRNDMARRRDDFEHFRYKNRCEEIEGKEKAI